MSGERRRACICGVVDCRRHGSRANWARKPRRQGDYGSGWQTLVRQILARDPLCILHYPGCEGRSVQVDHIVSVADGGQNTPENCRGVCRRCHQHRTSSQGGQAAKRSRERQKRAGDLRKRPG